jgi:hypothetical protein
LTFSDIFTAYYTQFRADSDIPTSTDDEYTVGLRLANEAINRWANFDATYWKELFTTAQTNSTGGVVTISTGVTSYAAPTAFREAGGFVKVLDSTGGTVQQYPIIEPQEVQFQGASAEYCYFTKAVSGQFTLHAHPAPTSALNGKSIDYVYYKNPTEFTTGTDTTEMSDPYFIVHRMLANQFRAARNPYYTSAKGDAENALKQMQVDNNSGSWANPWSQADNSGTSWGV